MSEVPVIVHTRDRFRVQRMDDDDEARRYVIVDTAGVVLRHELNLEDAKTWIDRVVDARPALASARPRHHR